MASTELILSIFQAGVLSNFSGEVPVGSLSMDVPYPNTNKPRPPKSSYRCGPVWILRCILTVTIIIVISSRTITCTAHIVNNMRQLYAANLLAVVCLDVDVRNYYIASVVWSLWP